MIDYISQNSILIPILALFSGIILTIIFKDRISALYKRFTSVTPVIRKYWTFITCFIFTVVLSYLFIFSYSPNQDWLNINLSILGQASALIFAIFIGYFAFLQVVESRISKLKEDGLKYFKGGQYSRAIKIYENLCSIDTRNFDGLSELLELYLTQKDFSSFDKKVGLLEENILDKKDKIVLLYLQISRELINEHISEAKEKINLLVEFQKQNREARMSWDFSDLRRSLPYKALQGDTKKYFDNTINYLTNMSEEDKIKFESGNYLVV